MGLHLLGISGSPRRDGNTDIAVQLALDEIKRRKDIETRFLRVAEFNIKPCEGCRKCMQWMRCAIDDDDFDGVFDEVMNATALVIGAPVYWDSPPGVMKNFIDRTHTFYACPDKFPSGKKVGLISVSAGGGFTSHERAMESWIRYYGMNIVDKIRIHAREKGEVRSRPAQLQKVKALAESLSRQIGG
jgi:multimeric flavodoxin WrbA